MLGSHLSIAGGMATALHETRHLHMDCVQVFTANQRQWSPRPPSDGEIGEWLTTLREMGWDCVDGQTPPRVVSHNSYLTNLASPSTDVWKRSLNAQRTELERCESLHIPFCVMHPGAHLGRPRKPRSPNDLNASPNPDELAGLRRIVKALDHLHRSLPGYRTITCLESTVGSGTNLGYSFQQLAFIREHVKQPERVGYCIDTCHLTAAGYDLSTSGNAAEVLDRFDTQCGMKNLRAIHLNDSIGILGSRLDRHAHIHEGCCGRGCFVSIMNHPALRTVPKILETPKGVNSKGTNWDTINIRRLMRLIKAPKT